MHFLRVSIESTTRYRIQITFGLLFTNTQVLNEAIREKNSIFSSGDHMVTCQNYRKTHGNTLERWCYNLHCFFFHFLRENWISKKNREKIAFLLAKSKPQTHLLLFYIHGVCDLLIPEIFWAVFSIDLLLFGVTIGCWFWLFCVCFFSLLSRLLYLLIRTWCFKRADFSCACDNFN